MPVLLEEQEWEEHNTVPMFWQAEVNFAFGPMNIRLQGSRNLPRWRVDILLCNRIPTKWYNLTAEFKWKFLPENVRP